MSEQKCFGDLNPEITYIDRTAAYAVILNGVDKVAAVKGSLGYFLPGGGLHPGETAQQALIREVQEELACGVQIIYEIGRAIQYFYVPSENCNYNMDAVFFLAELGVEIDCKAEYELRWIQIAEASRLLYHQCHAWAVTQAIR